VHRQREKPAPEADDALPGREGAEREHDLEVGVLDRHLAVVGEEQLQRAQVRELGGRAALEGPGLAAAELGAAAGLAVELGADVLAGGGEANPGEVLVAGLGRRGGDEQLSRRAGRQGGAARGGGPAKEVGPRDAHAAVRREPQPSRS
jgi:hypothetical protein